MINETTQVLAKIFTVGSSVVGILHGICRLIGILFLIVFFQVLCIELAGSISWQEPER